MGDQGSGVNQAEVDPKGLSVPLVIQDEGNKNLLKDSSNLLEGSSHEEILAQTPSLLNCSNVQFTFRQKKETEKNGRRGSSSSSFPKASSPKRDYYWKKTEIWKTKPKIGKRNNENWKNYLNQSGKTNA